MTGAPGGPRGWCRQRPAIRAQPVDPRMRDDAQDDDGGNDDIGRAQVDRRQQRPHLAHRLRGARCDGTAPGGRHIASARQLDDDGIVLARTFVIAVQGPTQPPGFDPHDRIGLGIELFVAAERLDRDRVALDSIALAGERRFDDEAQKGGELRRGAKRRTDDDAGQRGSDVLRSDTGIRRLRQFHLIPPPGAAQLSFSRQCAPIPRFT